MNQVLNSGNLEVAYQQAMNYAKTHYENFPVISFLLSKDKRKDIAIIYWFARTSDDLADEGDLSSIERLNALDSFKNDFEESLKSNYKNDFFQALHNTILSNNLSSLNFTNLISAFKQDIEKHRYQNFDEVLNYCQRSADPVGRLVLELHNIRDEKAFQWSDKICTALQLTNFYQDIEIDFKKGRIYLPEDEMRRFKVDENIFEIKQNSLNFSELLKFSVNRTLVMFKEGEKLLKFLPLKLRIEIKWTILGGKAILNKIKEADYKIFGNRPKLTKLDLIKILLKSIF